MAASRRHARRSNPEQRIVTACRTRFVSFATALVAALLAAAAPTLATVPGIDVSHFQGTINWTSVKNAGIEFAFAKATEGVDFIDVNFVQYMNGARAAGVLIGPYHFARPDSSVSNPLDAANEANDFVDAIQPYYQQYLGKIVAPVLDVERLPYADTAANRAANKAFLSNWVRNFNTVVVDRLGIMPIIYVNSYYATTFLETNINQYPLWLANYNYTPPTTPPPAQWGVWSHWDFWQYTSSGSVSGISGNVDRDLFNGTMLQLMEFVPGFLAGDYNRDGVVDGADYTKWRDTMGQSVAKGTGADGDFDGQVTAADYNLWKSNFGQTGAAAGALSTAAVPEPATMIFLIAAGLTALTRRTRR